MLPSKSPAYLKQVASVQLAATAVVEALAAASHPALTPTIEEPSPVFKGPLRQVLELLALLAFLIMVMLS